MPIYIHAETSNANAAEAGVLVGMVVDDHTNQPIEYANVAVYSSEDSSLVTGGITDTEGRFRIHPIKPGQYYATIKFIGYEETLRTGIFISHQEHMAKVGTIKLKQASQNLGEVEVVADKQQVIYKIDKKVVNPSQFIAAQGGSAVDVLANTPSVSVDIEGNVSMRGSSNFLVLVNGRPTPFEPSDALAQIPASSIENIEIITNPSAKYDPDGAAGIINIITKKGMLQGWNGMLNLNASTLGAYGGDFLFNFNGDKTKWYVGGNRTDRLRAADYSSENITTSGDTISYLNQEGDRSMRFFTNALKAGLDYDINHNNVIGIELNGGQSGRDFKSDLKNTEWINQELPTKSNSKGNTEARSFFYSGTLNQRTQFGDNKDHKLESSVFYQHKDGTDNTVTDKLNETGDLVDWQKTWEENRSDEWRIKSDYTRPWEKGKIEAGYQFRLDDNWNNYDAAFKDTLTEAPSFYNETQFFRMINGAYGTFSGEVARFGYQIGLRAEHTLRQLEDYRNDTVYEINRLDWYPTVHLSYDLKSDQQLMASFTRRIDRPRSYYLDPYLSWRDPNNVYEGNPALLPQYINSFELSYQKKFGYNFVTLELFHRTTLNKIERIRSVYNADKNIMRTSFENVGADYSTGAELMFMYNLVKWWQVNLSGSYYDYRIDVDEQFEADIKTQQSNNFRGRMSNTFKAGKTTRVQLDGMYMSPSVTAQGTREGMLYTSLAVKQSLLKRKLDLSASVIDPFNTAKMQINSSGNGFVSNYTFDMKSPYFMFTLAYRFNNYKPERKQRGEGGGMDMEF